MRDVRLGLMPMAVILVATFSLPASGRAQTLRPLTAGDRVRVEPTEGGARVTGTVTTAGDRFLAIEEPGGATRTLGYRDIRRLERSIGRTNHAGKGALIGGGIGLAIGSAYGILIVSALCDAVNGCAGDYPAAVLLVGGVFGLGGAGLGALVGLAVSGERWGVVPLGSSGIGLVAEADPQAGGGLSLGLQLRR